MPGTDEASQKTRVPLAGDDEAAHRTRNANDAGPGLLVKIEWRDGTATTLPLATFREVPPVLISRFTKLWAEKSRFGDDWEPVLQDIEAPLSAFRPDYAGAAPAAIAFVFDYHKDTVLILDDIGFARNGAGRPQE